jgi:hypothetical protein
MKMMTFGVAKVDDREVMLSPEQVRGEAQTIGEHVIGKNSRCYYADNYAPEGLRQVRGRRLSRGRRTCTRTSATP